MKMMWILQKVYNRTETCRKGLCVCTCLTLPLWGKRKWKWLLGDICK